MGSVKSCENTLLLLLRDRDRDSITSLTRERKSIDLVTGHELKRDRYTKHVQALTPKLFILKLLIKQAFDNVTTELKKTFTA